MATNDIKYLLVSHFHPDHAGLKQELKNLGAKLVLLESQIDFIAPLSDFYKRKHLPHVEIMQTGNIVLKFEDSRNFLAEIGLDGEIIPSAGHGMGGITLIQNEGFVFTGDLPAPSLIPDQNQTAKDSWDKICKHKVTRIFPGHG